MQRDYLSALLSMLTCVLEVALCKADLRLVPLQAGRVQLSLFYSGVYVTVHLRSLESDDFYVPVRCLMVCSGIQFLEREHCAQPRF